jgi:hypothetical protein
LFVAVGVAEEYAAEFAGGVAVGVGLGGYDGQSALALGGSYRVNPTTIVRGSVASGSASKTAVGVGVGFSW